MTRPLRVTAAIAGLTLLLSGCTFFDTEQRDQQACEAIGGSLDAEGLREGLSFASARLGRDIFDLSNLQRDLQEGSVVPTTGVMTRVQQLSQSVAVRCAQVGYSRASATPPPTTQGDIDVDETIALINELPVRPEDRSGYDRELFEHWVDDDRDGCDTRDEVLIAESLDDVELGPNCSISYGRWLSQYDKLESTEPQEFDIDHMVPLAEAWDSGASGWSPAKRRAFANDLTNPASLIAVSASSNRSKSDQDPQEWLPQNPEYICLYIRDWVTIKSDWDLSIDQTEKNALLAVIEGCR